jgi:hypothetical protein
VSDQKDPGPHLAASCYFTSLTIGLYFVVPRVKGMKLEVEKEEVLDNGYA